MTYRCCFDVCVKWMMNIVVLGVLLDVQTTTVTGHIVIRQVDRLLESCPGILYLEGFN